MNVQRIFMHVTLMTVFMIAVWGMDISITCMLHPELTMTNGFWNMNPITTYHISLYLMIITAFTMTIMGIEKSEK